MSTLPDISVVMSVYNDSDSLRKSLDSILEQEEVDLELIVVNDGSTDNSILILEEYKNSDKRIKILNQKHSGLTKALIIGCAQAQGEYIARHDASDTSMKMRLQNQLRCIKNHSEASLVSGGSRFLGPKDEYLYDVMLNPQEATANLLTLKLNQIRGPSHHGCTLFQKKAYQKVGGYRAAFFFSQDLDLWVRLAEYGEHIIIPDILYKAYVTAGSISGRYRREQIKLTRLILKCAKRRRNGEDESDILRQACAIRPSGIHQKKRLDHARTLYFIGRCLQKNYNPRAKQYFKKALAMFPLHLKAAIRWLYCLRL